jgi:hypothetical protein
MCDVVEKLNRAARLAYLYMLQRNHDDANWGHPGEFKLFDCGLARQIVVHVSEKIILAQPQDWSVLEPLVWRNVDGESVEQGYFFDILYRIMEASSGGAAITQAVQDDMYIKEEGVVLLDWDLGHNVKKSNLVLSKTKQRAMERGRCALLDKYPLNINPLPCTTNGNYTGPHQGPMGARSQTPLDTPILNYFPFLKQTRPGAP